MPRARDGEELSTLVRGAREEPQRGALRFTLRVVAGPDAGAAIEIDANRAAPALVGTSPVCDLRLSDRTASRRHASFEIVERGLHVIDLGSRNGLVAQGLIIGEAVLRGGETLVLGATHLAVTATTDGQQAPLPEAARFGRMIGVSAAMRCLYPLCERLAACDIPVLIEGETGTGKEVLAEALHEAGARATKPFVVFDCAAVTPSLVESALFGHHRGAFTGATTDRAGVFEQANTGTLFLDEIGDLDATLQPKLLRVLERGEVQRVGANAWAKVDVRVIAATRRDSDREVQAGRFRDDLFYRLAVGRIELPPLRRREGDVTLLALQFCRTLGGHEASLTKDVLDRFRDYRWPGNVRELRNAVARVLALGESFAAGETGDVGDAARYEDHDVVAKVLEEGLPFARARSRVVAEFERRYVEQVLARHQGNVGRAAAASGIARRYFQLIRARRRG